MYKFYGVLIISMGLTSPVFSDATTPIENNQRYEIVSIKRDVASGTNIRTVNATMMLDRLTGKNWILDEIKGRWVPVGYHNKLSGNDATLVPQP